MPATVKTSRIFPDELLSRHRQTGDPEADAVIGGIASAEGHAGVGRLMQWLTDNKNFSTENQPDSVLHFFQKSGQLPRWADARKMERGMRFFEKHAAAIALALGCYSLPYCYLGANGARVLWLSQRIHSDTRKRLEETGDWVFAVTKRSNWQTGISVAYTLKIRLMHAAIRWFTLHSGEWNAAWGHPVNQEDMAGTNLAFSYIVIRGLRLAGIRTDEADEEAYLHHLNVVGYLLGVREELLPQNLREAFHLDRAIARRQFRPSEQGKGLTRSLLNAIEEATPPSLRNLPAAQMRFFLGDDHADWLGVPDVPLEKRLVGLASALPIFPNLIASAQL